MVGTKPLYGGVDLISFARWCILFQKQFAKPHQVEHARQAACRVRLEKKFPVRELNPINELTSKHEIKSAHSKLEASIHPSMTAYLLSRYILLSPSLQP